MNDGQFRNLRALLDSGRVDALGEAGLRALAIEALRQLDERDATLMQIGWSDTTTLFLSLNLTTEQSAVLQHAIALVSAGQKSPVDIEASLTTILTEWLKTKEQQATVITPMKRSNTELMA